MSDCAHSAGPLAISQSVGATQPYQIDVNSAPAWRPNTPIQAGTVIEPTGNRRTGFVYVAVGSGQTGRREPIWVTQVELMNSDGSLNWIAHVPPAPGQDIVDSATWTQVSPPDGELTISGQTVSGLSVGASVSGGTAGLTYRIRVEIVMSSGLVRPMILDLTIDTIEED